MTLELNIYDGAKIIKTYTADTIDCSFGVVEDILNALNFESIKTGNKFELAAMVVKCMDQLKPFLKEIFAGVTDEELRKAKMSNIIDIFKNLYYFANVELGKVTTDEKN